MGTSRGVAEAEVPVGLPVGLASMVPGAQLAVLLGSVDRSRVGCDELPDLVAARARLAAHTEAELLADLWEAARGILDEPQDGVVRYTEEELVNYAARVLGWALHNSDALDWAVGPPRPGGRILGARLRVFAGDAGRALVVRLPMVLAALRAGQIDSDKGRVIAE